MSSTRSPFPKAPATEPARRAADAGLIVCAHGIGGGPGIARDHAAAIARSGRFADVSACALDGAPSLATVLARVGGARVVVAPTLLAAGVVWRRLETADLAACAHGRPVRLLRPLGENAGLARLIVARALAACVEREWPPAAATLLLVGHGTPRDPASGACLRAHARNLAARRLFAAVRCAFLEQQPHLDDVLAQAGGRPTVAIGYFADRGRHGESDLRRPFGAEHSLRCYAGPIGTDPAVARLIAHMAGAVEDAPSAA